MISIVDVESVERSWRPEEMARRGVEAQESSNLTLYRTALHHETHNCADEAMHAYSKLLEQPLIADASRERAASRDPSLQLRFLALKNLSALESTRPSDCDEYGMLTESALQHALEALAIDETDSLLWLRLGRLAQRTGRVSLARHALEQSVLMSPHNQLARLELRALLASLDDYVSTCQLHTMSRGDAQALQLHAWQPAPRVPLPSIDHLRSDRGREPDSVPEAWCANSAGGATASALVRDATAGRTSRDSLDCGSSPSLIYESLQGHTAPTPPATTLRLARTSWSSVAKALLQLWLSYTIASPATASTQGETDTCGREARAGQAAGGGTAGSDVAAGDGGPPLATSPARLGGRPATAAVETSCGSSGAGRGKWHDARAERAGAAAHGRGEDAVDGLELDVPSLTALFGRRVKFCFPSASVAPPAAHATIRDGQVQADCRSAFDSADPTADSAVRTTAAAESFAGEHPPVPILVISGAPSATTASAGSVPLAPAARAALPAANALLPAAVLPPTESASATSAAPAMTAQYEAAQLVPPGDAAVAASGSFWGSAPSGSAGKRRAVSNLAQQMPARRRRVTPGSATQRPHGAEAEGPIIVNRPATLEQLLERFVPPSVSAHTPRFPPGCPAGACATRCPAAATSSDSTGGRGGFGAAISSCGGSSVTGAYASPACSSAMEVRPTGSAPVLVAEGPMVHASTPGQRGPTDGSLDAAVATAVAYAAPSVCHAFSSSPHESSRGVMERGALAWLSTQRVQANSGVLDVVDALLGFLLDQPAVPPPHDADASLQRGVVEGPAVEARTPCAPEVVASLSCLPAVERDELGALLLRLHDWTSAHLAESTGKSPDRLVSLAEIVISAAARKVSADRAVAARGGVRISRDPSPPRADVAHIVRDVQLALMLHAGSESVWHPGGSRRAEPRLWARLSWALALYAEARADVASAVFHLRECARAMTPQSQSPAPVRRGVGQLGSGGGDGSCASCAHAAIAAGDAAVDVVGCGDVGCASGPPAALSFVPHPLSHHTSCHAITLTDVEAAQQRHSYEEQLHETRGTLGDLVLHSAECSAGEWMASVTHAGGEQEGVRGACEAAWEGIIGLAEAAVRKVELGEPGEQGLVESLRLLTTCWIGLCQDGAEQRTCQAPDGVAQSRGGAVVGHEAVSLPVLRARFGRVLGCLDRMLLGWMRLLALSAEGCRIHTEPEAAAAKASASSLADGATADNAAVDKAAAADGVWQVVQEVLISLLQAIDSFHRLDASHCGALHAAPARDPETADAVASDGWAEGACVEPARAIQRTLLTLAVRALPRAARVCDWDGVKGSRRALHLSLCALCKAWLSCVRKPGMLAEGVALLQRCWDFLLREQVRATPLPVFPPAGATSRGKVGKRQRHESPFAQICASQALAWLRWPEHALHRPQLPQQVWRPPAVPATDLGSTVISPDSCHDRIGFRIAEAAAGMGYVAESSAEDAGGDKEGGAGSLEGEERDRAEGVAAALGEAMRKSNAEAVEVMDRPVPAAEGWSLRWRPRRNGGGKGDSCLIAPDGTKAWSIRAARRFLRLEPPMGAIASERAVAGPTRAPGRSMRSQATRDAGASSTTLELHIVDVPARVGSALDEPMGTAIRGLLDTCIEHLFGKEVIGDDVAAAAGASAPAKQPPREHKGCVALQSATPPESELLLQYQLMQCPAGVLNGCADESGAGVIRAQPERNRRKRLRDQLRRFLPVELAPGKGEGDWVAISVESGFAGSSAGPSGSPHPLAAVLPLLPPPLRPRDAAAAPTAAGPAEAVLSGGWMLGAHLCAALASLEDAVGESDYVAEVVDKALQRPDRGAVPGATCDAADCYAKFILWSNTLRAQALRLSIMVGGGSVPRRLPPGMPPVPPPRQALAIATYARKLWGLKIDAALHSAGAPQAEARAAVAAAASMAHEAADLCHGCLTALLSAAEVDDEVVDADILAEVRLEMGTLLATEAAILRCSGSGVVTGSVLVAGAGMLMGDGGDGGGGATGRGVTANLQVLRTGHCATSRAALCEAILVLSPSSAGGSVGEGKRAVVGDSEEMDVEAVHAAAKSPRDASVSFASRLLLGCARRDLGDAPVSVWLADLLAAAQLASAVHHNAESLALTELGVGLVDQLVAGQAGPADLERLAIELDTDGLCELLNVGGDRRFQLAKDANGAVGERDTGLADASVGESTGSAARVGGVGLDEPSAPGWAGGRFNPAVACCVDVCEQLLVRALQLNPWQHRARLALARLCWSVLSQPHLALQQLHDLISMGRGKSSAFFNMYQAPGKPGSPVSDDSRLGRMRRTCELYADCSAAARLYADVHLGAATESADPSVELERLLVLCSLLKEERMDADRVYALRAYVKGVHGAIQQRCGGGMQTVPPAAGARQPNAEPPAASAACERLACAAYRIHQDVELSSLLQPMDLPLRGRILRSAVALWRDTMPPAATEGPGADCITNGTHPDACGSVTAACSLCPADALQHAAAPPPLPAEDASDETMFEFCRLRFGTAQHAKRLKLGKRAGSALSAGGGQKRSRCGECASCRAENCEKCTRCLDMPKFGGPGSMRQPCVKRVCEQLQREDSWLKQMKARTTPASVSSAVAAAVQLAASLAAAPESAASGEAQKELVASLGEDTGGVPPFVPRPLGYTVDDVD